MFVSFGNHFNTIIMILIDIQNTIILHFGAFKMNIFNNPRCISRACLEPSATLQLSLKMKV